jgi:hypothetical protein
MSKFIKTLLFSGLGAILGLATVGMKSSYAASFSQIVNLNATTSNNRVQLNLNAGIYDVEYIGIAEGGQYDAWSAWRLGPSTPSGCNNLGTNCSTGWLNTYYYNIASSNFTGALSSNDLYATPLLAKQNGVDTTFSLTQNNLVSFYILDRPYTDNSGGISLRVTSRVVTPEPITLAGLGVVGMVGLTMRRKKPVAA